MTTVFVEQPLALPESANYIISLFSVLTKTTISCVLGLVV